MEVVVLPVRQEERRHHARWVNGAQMHSVAGREDICRRKKHRSLISERVSKWVSERASEWNSPELFRLGLG